MPIDSLFQHVYAKIDPVYIRNTTYHFGFW